MLERLDLRHNEIHSTVQISLQYEYKVLLRYRYYSCCLESIVTYAGSHVDLSLHLKTLDGDQVGTDEIGPTCTEGTNPAATF